MTARTILHTFDVYRVARMAFIQNVADMALRPQNIEVLLSAGILALLRPLLTDVCLQIEQCAAITLGRIAHHAGPNVALEILEGGIIGTLLQDLQHRNKHYKRAAMFVLRSICRHGQHSTEAVIAPGTGALDALMFCLVDLDTGVREAAAWAAGYISRNSMQLAKVVVDAGAVPHLVACLQEPELSVRRVAASALADISRHGPDLAHIVMQSTAIVHLARACLDRDDVLKRQALLALGAIAKQSRQSAEFTVQAEIFPDIFVFLASKCPIVRRNAAMLIRDVVRHTPELAQLVVNTGGVGALVEAIKIRDSSAIKTTSKPSAEAAYSEADDYRIPVIAALGYIAGHAHPLAMCVVNCDGIRAVCDALTSLSAGCELQTVSAWCLGQIGRYCPEQVAATGILAHLMELATNPSSTEELRTRCQTALRMCVQGCTTMTALEPLVQNAPMDVLTYVLGQLAKILPHDPSARRFFVTSGGLKRIQEIESEAGSTLMEYISLINACFPEEIVRYYTPGYPDLLLQKVEQFQPQLGGEDDSVGIIMPDETTYHPSVTVSRELDILFDD